MTAKVRPIVAFFKDIDKGDLSLAGGKGANLGEMTQAGFPVPPGFAVTVEAYDIFIEENGLLAEITAILKSTDVNDPEQLNAASKKIQKIILSAPVPDIVFKETVSAYRKLSGPFNKALVAVRSSATAEDLPGASFAGQQDTYLNVKGEANLIDKVRACWASLFTARAIFYRVQNKIPHEKVKLCAIVQKMIESEVSGVMFTLDPVSNDKDRIIIEAVWGLGEMIVQGSVVPDHYVVQKETFAILSKEISDQSIKLVRSEIGNKEVEVPLKVRNLQKIPNEAVEKLARIGQNIQEHYYFPQDIEWSYEKGKLYIIQSRPITTINTQKQIKATEMEQDNAKLAAMPFLVGLGASPGIATGPVKILKSAKEIGRIKKG
ncbi:MAG: PEP/pyruvate-binding domain-containing protein, partial [Patescibacteria group bacterium]